MKQVVRISYILSMKNLLSKIFLLILTAVFIIPWSVRPVQAKVSDWQKGVSLYPTINNDFASQKFQASLKDAASIGANMATFIVPYYQTYHGSADIQKGWNTPTDQSLVAGIKYAHSLGMKTTIKIHLSAYRGDTWAAYINPIDRQGWLKNYSKLLNRYATLAEKNGVEQFCIGNELTSMSSDVVNPQNRGDWKNLISQVRAKYNGKVFYNANWGEEKDEIGFWEDLDYIGLSAYFTLSKDLQASWTQWNETNILPLQQKVNKPVLFTEIGYRSVKNARNASWNFSADWEYDGQEQYEDYEALFKYWDNFHYMHGFNIWNWETDPNAGGEGNTDYTIQNKPAQDLVREWFKK
jgi:hypothetical protein